ncbi:MAG: hypothetical protein QM783_07950 [Phycisphaerales bacterium]
MQIPIPFLGIGAIMKVLFAVGIYWLGIWAFIGRDPKTTNMIALAHAVTTIVFFVQTALWSSTYEHVEW